MSLTKRRGDEYPCQNSQFLLTTTAGSRQLGTIFLLHVHPIFILEKNEHEIVLKTPCPSPG